MAMTAGASLANMSEAWWAPTYQVPGEIYDGHVMTRHMIDDLALPGTILVNREGERFVNEATNYNDISKTFHSFDPRTYDFANVPSFLVFDDRVKSSYSIATVPASARPPVWFNTSDNLDELAARVGIDARRLEETVHRFNGDAVNGRDTSFGRGERALDLYYGDPDHLPNPSLGTVERPPFHAIEVLPGVLGTKGGALTDNDGRVLDHSQQRVQGLWAVGNAAASIMGPGYPGAGGSLGPILTGALRCGRAIGSM
jgi:succinate dehydrogenase/fumarate reductase flavoprotein subunit